MNAELTENPALLVDPAPLDLLVLAALKELLALKVIAALKVFLVTSDLLAHKA